MVTFTEKESQYINFNTSPWSCKVSDIPEDVLLSLKKKDKFHFDFIGTHIINFIQTKEK